MGYGGFCGWPRVCRLANGDLYVVFFAGYAHASWVNPRKNVPPEYTAYMNRMFKGGADWLAPDGGHIMWTRSTDEGATWTRPRNLYVLPDAYSAGTVMQAADGTMFAAAVIQTSHFWATRVSAPVDPIEFLRYMNDHFPEVIAVFRSDDNGEHWSEVARTAGPFLCRLNSPSAIVEAPDGALRMHLDGQVLPGGERMPGPRWVMALLRSTDRGGTWETWSIFGDPDHDMEEGHICYLPDGRLATASRPHAKGLAMWRFSAEDGAVFCPPSSRESTSHTRRRTS